MAQGNLFACLPVILGYEGGYTDDPRDNGNWTGDARDKGTLKGTNFGIAASSHPTLDIAHLTKADAEAIYQREYWTPAGCEALPAGLDLSHFDATVNSGKGASAKWLKKAMLASTAVDRIHAYAKARLTSMQAFSAWATFGKGWSTRVAGVEAKSLKMTMGEDMSIEIADAGAKAATKAKVASAVAHASTGTATAAVVAGAASGHSTIGAAVGLAFVVSAIWSAFHASTSGARAATLAAHAATA